MWTFYCLVRGLCCCLCQSVYVNIQCNNMYILIIIIYVTTDEATSIMIMKCCVNTQVILKSYFTCMNW